MGSLSVIRGLPSCGKTTFAQEWVDQDPAARVRVSRPDLDAMMGGEWSEPRARVVRDAVVSALLKQDRDVIYDDLNLKSKAVRDLQKLATFADVPFLIYDMTNIELEEVLRRNAQRDRPVPEDVIVGYWRAFIRGSAYPLPLGEEPAGPEPLDPYVRIEGIPTYLVDVDGTVAIMGDREPVDYDKAYLDRPNQDVIELLRHLDSLGQVQFIFISGRSEDCRDVTEKWLQAEVSIEYGRLFMRPSGDGRQDAVIKAEIFDREIRERYNVVGVFDDRNQVVQMWRSLGLTVFQVADGNF